METLSDILFVISNGLMIPVLLLLIFFLIRGIIMVVQILPEISRQRKERIIVNNILENIPLNNENMPLNNEDWIKQILSVEGGIFKNTVSDIVAHADDTAYCERKIANYEIEVRAVLSKSRLLIKFGPMLGLMGTLIPMGPALVGLASGDLSSMAYNMQVAFATTVVGMVIAAIGVITLQINRNYYAYMVNDIEFVFNKISETNEKAR